MFLRETFLDEFPTLWPDWREGLVSVALQGTDRLYPASVQAHPREYFLGSADASIRPLLNWPDSAAAFSQSPARAVAVTGLPTCLRPDTIPCFARFRDHGLRFDEFQTLDFNQCVIELPRID